MFCKQHTLFNSGWCTITPDTQRDNHLALISALNKVRMRYFLWDDSSRHDVFLALRSWDAAPRYGPAVVGRNSISSHRSRQNAFNCSVMAFHFLKALFANTYRCSNTARLFLTRPCPHVQAENEGYEERRKQGGRLKRKHQGYILNSLGHATVSAAK